MTCHKIKLSSCIMCEKPLDAASGVGQTVKPRSGDITICVYCGHLMAFSDDLSLRNLNDTEIMETSADPRILVARQTIAEAKRKFYN